MLHRERWPNQPPRFLRSMGMHQRHHQALRPFIPIFRVPFRCPVLVRHQWHLSHRLLSIAHWSPRKSAELRWPLKLPHRLLLTDSLSLTVMICIMNIISSIPEKSVSITLRKFFDPSPRIMSRRSSCKDDNLFLKRKTSNNWPTDNWRTKLFDWFPRKCYFLEIVFLKTEKF